jgi:hypothetical protein
LLSYFLHNNENLCLKLPININKKAKKKFIYQIFIFFSFLIKVIWLKQENLLAPFLFLLVVKGMSVAITRAEELVLFIGFKGGVDTC